MTKPVDLYQDFVRDQNIFGRIRNILRDNVVSVLSIGASIRKSSNWIRFPYYHHVFNDERSGFSAQLDYLKQFGEFISLEDAVNLITSRQKFKGRYFCITFDDGFKNNFLNALPILVDKDIKATFFLATDYINCSVKDKKKHMLGFFKSQMILMEFLTWNDCHKMIEAGMEIGSHTVNHSRLSQLDENAVNRELLYSKATIERNLGIKCNHFCAPFGQPALDFDTKRDPSLVKEAGYSSMLTTERGPMFFDGNPYRICRDHILANWSLSQLRYFFSRD